jgi:hypothetical protein
VHTVFSIGNNAYQRWQARLLAYSHRRAGQPGPLTCLVSGLHDQAPVIGRDFFTRNYFPHPVTGDRYAAYNKPAALLAWLQSAPPREETILLVDPDCVFLAATVGEAERGRPVAQPVFYMNARGRPNPVTPPAGQHPVLHIDWTPVEAAVAKYCRRPGRVQGVGIPTLIHRDDLAALAPLWLAKTEMIRGDPELRDGVGWVAEMWGYCLAAAERGLAHEERDLACFATEDRDDLPLVHYCYDVRDRAGRWTWGKRSYRPWTRVPEPSADVPRAGRALLRILNEFVESQEDV